MTNAVLMTRQPMTLDADADRLRITPQQAIDWGFSPIPLRATGDTKAPRPAQWEQINFTPKDWRHGEGTGLRCGRQLNGTYLNVADFDHKPDQGIDAPAEFDAALARIPEPIRAQMLTTYSTSRRGRYIIFRSSRRLPKAWLQDTQGRKIGDFLGEGAQVVAPTPDRWIQGTLTTIPLLHDDDLDTVLAALNYQAGIDAQPSTVPWPEVEQILANIHQLLNVDGLPRRLTNPKGQARRVLTGETHMSSRSDDRACVCRSLVLHGYPDAEIAALLIHLCDYDDSARKGSKWLYQDIERLIGKERARQPQATPSPSRTQYTQPAESLPDVPRASRARKDRPQRIDAAAYLAWLQAQIDANGIVLATRTDAAAALAVSVPTIARIEAQLKADGQIRRETARKGHPRSLSWVVVLGAINIAPAQPETAPDLAPEVLSDPPRNIDTRARKEKHTAPIGPTPPDAPLPRLGAAVAEFFDAYPTARPSLARVRKYLADNYPDATWTPAAIACHYRATMERRTWQRQIDQLQTLKQKKLDQRERWVDRILAGGRAGPEGKLYGMAEWLAPHIRAEQERRGPALQRLKAGKRTRQAEIVRADNTDFPLAEQIVIGDAAPPAVDQAEIVALLELEPTAPCPPTPAGIGAYGGVCSFPLASDVLAGPVYTPETSPGVAKGYIAADDPWFEYNRAIQPQAEAVPV